MLYDFDYAIKRWEEESPDVLKYIKKYENMRAGTIVSYNGWLKNLNFLYDLLKIVGEELPQIDWMNDDIACHFYAEGDGSRFKISIYDGEKIFDGDSDCIIKECVGSLTAEQMDYIIGLLRVNGKIEANVFLGFHKTSNCDTFDELSTSDFVCSVITKF